MSTALARVRALEIRSLFPRTLAQPAAIGFAMLYLFFEYIRPSGMYPVLDVLPWARISLILAFVSTLAAGRSSLQLAPGWLLLSLFTGVILLSILQSEFPSAGFEKFNLWLSWLMVIFIVSSAASNEEQLILIIGAFVLWNLKMSFGGFKSWASAGFQFRAWGITGPSGWFQNSGEFGTEMAVFLPIAIYFLIGLHPYLGRTKHWFLAFGAFTAVVGMVGSSSRGALLGGAGVGLWFLWRSPNRVKGFFYIGLLAAAAMVFLPEAQKQRFRESGSDRTSQSRITLWKDGIEITKQHPVLGIGFNAWTPYYQRYYNPKGKVQHNIFVEAASELGFPGLLLFIALIGYTFWENRRTRHITKVGGSNPNRFIYYMAHGFDGALIGYLVSGFFVTILFYPYFWVNLAFTMSLAMVSRQRQSRRPLRGRHAMLNRRPPALLRAPRQSAVPQEA